MKIQSTLLLLLLAAAISCSGSKVKPDGGSTDAGDDGGDTDTGEDPLSRIAVACAAGSEHTCALNAAGGVKCWGGQTQGCLGTQTIGGPIPTDVVGLQSGVVDICAESNNTCALMEDGGVKCWGDNLYGQLGNGSMGGGYAEIPSNVIGLGGKAVQVECGMQFACALLEDGRIMCWGNGNNGELGNGIDLDLCVEWYSCIQPEPAEVVGLSSSPTLISLGTSSSFALNEQGSVWGWGNRKQIGVGEIANNTSTPQNVVGLSGVISGISSSLHTCVLTPENDTYCWGVNSDGQVGDGTHDNIRYEAVLLDQILPRSVGITCDGAHTCVNLEDGRVKCWGNNELGQLGNGEWGHDVISPTPVDVMGLENHFVVSLCGGGGHTCAIMDDGSMKCWGKGSSGQLGNDIDITTCDEWDDCIFPEPVDVLGFGPE